MAEICGEYLKKGRPVFLEGRIQSRNWEDKEGNKRYTTEIVANNVQFLGSRERGTTSARAPAVAVAADVNTQAPAPMPPEPPDAGGAFSEDDDIPF